MKKSLGCGLVICMVVGLSSPTVFGWGFNQHSKLAYRVFGDARISTAMDNLCYDRGAVASHAQWADTEELPDFHPWQGFDNIDTWAHYTSFWAPKDRTETHAGWLVHNICDNAMPIGHSPGNLGCTSGCCGLFESVFEVITNDYNPVAWPNPPYYSEVPWSDYDGYMGIFRAQVIATGQTANGLSCDVTTAYFAMPVLWRIFYGTAVDNLYKRCAKTALRGNYDVYWMWLTYW